MNDNKTTNADQKEIAEVYCALFETYFDLKQMQEYDEAALQKKRTFSSDASVFMKEVAALKDYDLQEFFILSVRGMLQRV